LFNKRIYSDGYFFLDLRINIKNSKTYYPNLILPGDLNLDFDDPSTDKNRIVKYMKSYNPNISDEVNVNFPFIDIHPNFIKVFRTNARLSETFDQIG